MQNLQEAFDLISTMQETCLINQLTTPFPSLKFCLEDNMCREVLFYEPFIKL